MSNVFNIGLFHAVWVSYAYLYRTDFLEHLYFAKKWNDDDSNKLRVQYSANTHNSNG